MTRAQPDVHGLRYQPALDGVRGLAVLGVVSGHAGVTGFGGYHGVTAFFVLSGYLITGILLREVSRTGTVDLRAFYRRRAARLAPALVLVVLVSTVWLLAAGVSPRSWWAGPVAALTYSMDLVQALWGNGSVSAYFQWSWSLSIEEQFYLGWPVVLLALLKRRRRTAVLALVGTGIVLVWVARTVQSAAGASHELAFYGPFSHDDALLLGTALAVLEAWPGADRRLRAAGRVLGPLGLLGLGVLFVRPTGLLGWSGLDGEGFGQTAWCAAGLVLWLVSSRGSLVARVLSLRPLVLLGKLSYGLYLWNLLTILVFTDLVGRPPVGSPFGVLWGVGLLAVCWASWRFVETPLRARWSRRGAAPGGPHGTTPEPARSSPAQAPHGG